MIRDVRPHQVVATSDQIVEEAIGDQYGNALNWHYTL
jgi:hypothetical protein